MGLSWYLDGQQIVIVGFKLGFYNMEMEGVEMIDYCDMLVLMLFVVWYFFGIFLVLGDYGDVE